MRLSELMRAGKALLADDERRVKREMAEACRPKNVYRRKTRRHPGFTEVGIPNKIAKRMGQRRVNDA